VRFFKFIFIPFLIYVGAYCF